MQASPTRRARGCASCRPLCRGGHPLWRCRCPAPAHAALLLGSGCSCACPVSEPCIGIPSPSRPPATIQALSSPWHARAHGPRSLQSWQRLSSTSRCRPPLPAPLPLPAQQTCTCGSMSHMHCPLHTQRVVAAASKPMRPHELQRHGSNSRSVCWMRTCVGASLEAVMGAVVAKREPGAGVSGGAVRVADD